MERDLGPGGTAGMVYYCGSARFNNVIEAVIDRLGIGVFYLSPMDDIAEGKTAGCRPGADLRGDQRHHAHRLVEGGDQGRGQADDRGRQAGRQVPVRHAGHALYHSRRRTSGPCWRRPTNSGGLIRHDNISAQAPSLLLGCGILQQGDPFSDREERLAA